MELFPVSAAPSSEAELSDATESLAQALRGVDVEVELRQPAWPVRVAPNSEAELCDFLEFVAGMLRAELRERQAAFDVAVEIQWPGTPAGARSPDRVQNGVRRVLCIEHF